MKLKEMTDDLRKVVEGKRLDEDGRVIGTSNDEINKSLLLLSEELMVVRELGRSLTRDWMERELENLI